MNYAGDTSFEKDLKSIFPGFDKVAAAVAKTGGCQDCPRTAASGPDNGILMSSYSTSDGPVPLLVPSPTPLVFLLVWSTVSI